MPANSLSVESREFTKFNASRRQGRIDITGKYTVSVSNGGFFPVFGATLNVTSLKSPENEIELIAQETASLGTISGAKLQKQASNSM
jgi:hypothetical protein